MEEIDSMKKKQEFIGYVEKVDFPNKGYVKVDEETVIVKNVIPGQQVRGITTKRRNGKFLGRLLETVESSPDAVVAPCPVFGECGGCLYQSMPYEKQLALKERQVRELIENVTGPLGERYDGIIASPEHFHYRNKMEYSFGDAQKDGPLVLGMHKRGSTYDISPAGDCQIVHEDFNKILNYTVELFRQDGLSYYHKRTHEGYLRYLLVRRGVNTKEFMVNLVTSSQMDYDLTPWLEGLIKLAEQAFDNELVSVVHTVSDTLSDAVKPEDVNLLYGRDFIYEELLGLRFKISPFSFFQTNSLGAEKLYDVVRQYIGETKDKVVFDLYSGTGTITQLLAPVAAKAVGVEIVEEAVDAAKENAKLNQLSNCEFIAGDVLAVLDDLTDKPDLIVLDPPRDGIHPKALPKIIEFGVDKMVYVSCKPTSLARDLIVFQEAGYEVQKMTLVDLFPHTVHVETVVLMSRVKVNTMF
jgi:23S rRNA (uracil-5-)-methyltransferase RumA